MNALLLLTTLLVTQVIIKNDPNGIWENQTGSQYEFRLSGTALHVSIVPGSNPKLLKYEVDMKSQEELNTYKGNGFFVAKMSSGKECRFDTEWHLVVVSQDRIIGITTDITADKDTCEIQEKGQVQLDLKKRNK
jgi:hypothetical protein